MTIQTIDRPVKCSMLQCPKTTCICICDWCDSYMDFECIKKNVQRGYETNTNIQLCNCSNAVTFELTKDKLQKLAFFQTIFKITIHVFGLYPSTSRISFLRDLLDFIEENKDILFYEKNEKLASVFKDKMKQFYSNTYDVYIIEKYKTIYNADLQDELFSEWINKNLRFQPPINTCTDVPCNTPCKVSANVNTNANVHPMLTRSKAKK